MKIVLAPNAFKESLTQWQAAKALAGGLRRVLPDAEIVLAPMADGGDGTAETLLRAADGRWVKACVRDPLQRPIEARYAISRDRLCAFLEMAQASGLSRLAPKERNPLRTSTIGTGELILHALSRGATRLVVGVGGSATVDGGIGMAAALGYRFLDARGRTLPPCGGALEDIASIDPGGFLQWRASLKQPLSLAVAVDVTNPLLGPKGAAPVFAPQKGATPSQVKRLEAGLRNLAERIRRDLGIRVTALPGGGAAGGLAAGLHAFCKANVQPGAELIAAHIGLESALRGATCVITGEGRIDRQTIDGKAPAVVARIARAQGVPLVLAVAGSVDPSLPQKSRACFDAVFSICDGPMSLDSAMANAAPLLARIGVNIAGILRVKMR